MRAAELQIKETAGRARRPDWEPSEICGDTTSGAEPRPSRPRPPGRAETIKFLTQDETRRLFSVIRGRRDRALFLIAYRHGLRASEVGLLQTGDFDFKEQRAMFHRLKGSLSGQHPLQPDEAKALKAYVNSRKGHDAVLFASRRGTSISRRPRTGS